MMIPVMAACWVTLMSSSPSEMCLSAASVTTLLLKLLVLLVLLVLQSSGELDGDDGLVSGRGGSASSPDTSLQEDRRRSVLKTNLHFPGDTWLPVRTYRNFGCVSGCSSGLSSTNGSSVSAQVTGGWA